MAIAKAYGSITIVDIGDLGTLSVYPESNQPTSVIYDPNTNGGTYNPDWSGTNLQLTPVIYYGGTQIDAANAAISVVWKRKVGSGDENSISVEKGESMNDTSKKLTVNKNVLNSSNPIITYICIVTYTEPQTGTDLVAKGQISFSLISQPTNIKSCSIVGESVFLYNSAQALVGAETITLTAKVDNCDVASWAYKNSSGEFVTIDGQLSTTLTVAATDNSYFNNDVATIRLNTNVTGLYDLHTITRIRDGAPGESVLSITLDNEDMYVPCDADGNVLDGGLNNAKTTITVYSGNDDVTDEATITPVTSGVTGSYDNTTYTYTVTEMSALTATVTFNITYNGKTVSKVFYLTKLKQGNDGDPATFYSLDMPITINKTPLGHIYTQNSFTAKARLTVGSDTTDVAGRFKIYYDDVQKDQQEDDTKTSITHNLPDGTNISSIKVEFYAPGNFETLLCSQSITVVNNGDKGDTGDGGISFNLHNPADVIPCTTGGLVSTTQTIKIPFSAYQGITRIACTAEHGALPTGMSATVTNATKESDGCLTITVSANANLGGTTDAYNTGTIAIALTAGGQTSEHIYTWTKNRQAASGTDAVLLRAYAPRGNIINNGENNVQLSCTLTKGTTTVTPSAYKWYVFNNTSLSYTEITSSNTDGYTGYTTATLTVPATAVSSYASYCIEVTYDDKPYTDYIAVQDKTDPLQVEIFSTLGDKITNGVGVGCVYARVYQNGTELDALQNLKVTQTAPASPSEGDIWAHIDSSEKIILKKRIGDSWTAFNLIDTDPTSGSADIKKQCTYTWTFGDYDGVATNLNNQVSRTDKFLYIKGKYITKKMQFNLEVTKQ